MMMMMMMRGTSKTLPVVVVTAVFATLLLIAPSVVDGDTNATTTTTLTALPEIGSLIDSAFPMWEVDENGKRLETKDCTVDSCEWNPFYITKRYDGLHPDFGGHPTDNDVQYPFYASSPYEGQPYPGTPHHCPLDSSDDIKAGDCPKITTLSDSVGGQGPGHVPPHISLISLTWAVEAGELYDSLDELFDYDSSDCRIIPDVLFQMVREYFPRTEEGVAVEYPPPIVPEGGDYQYEFPAGNGLENQAPPYAGGPPHWCTQEMTDSGHWDGVCPYVYLGPDAGKYRHPHIALAALEVYLAHRVMPDQCKSTWLENNPDFLDADRVTSDTPFPVMSNDETDNDPTTVENWLGQPVLPWNYTSGAARPGVKAMYAEDTVQLLNLEEDNNDADDTDAPPPATDNSDVGTDPEGDDVPVPPTTTNSDPATTTTDPVVVEDGSTSTTESSSSAAFAMSSGSVVVVATVIIVAMTTTTSVIGM
mmetsp:Transcript_55432/g.60050  ORF Transcript_55432/g.60050 Transcript_55432/m.60050 type:complete len:476 (+) Transcript_55432:107-1534(+)